MHLAALLVGLSASVAIIVLGARFLLRPRQATLDFGIAADNLRGLTEIKGARDITSGVVLLVVWASTGHPTLGWVLVAAAITPAADALIVLTNGGQLARALGVHGLTAALLVAAGLVLALA
jgi:cytochrome c biogenesis protein CcdA